MNPLAQPLFQCAQPVTPHPLFRSGLVSVLWTGGQKLRIATKSFGRIVSRDWGLLSIPSRCSHWRAPNLLFPALGWGPQTGGVPRETDGGFKK